MSEKPIELAGVSPTSLQQMPRYQLIAARGGTVRAEELLQSRAAVGKRVESIPDSEAVSFQGFSLTAKQLKAGIAAGNTKDWYPRERVERDAVRDPAIAALQANAVLVREALWTPRPGGGGGVSRPQIHETGGGDPNFPGTTLLIRGTGFGNVRGSVHMEMETYDRRATTLSLRILPDVPWPGGGIWLSWTDQLIITSIPNDLSGFLRQVAVVVVSRPDSLEASHRITIDLDKDVIHLNANTSRTLVRQCASSAFNDEDRCFSSSEGTFWAVHHGFGSGTDRLAMSLRNEWTVYSVRTWTESDGLPASTVSIDNAPTTGNSDIYYSARWDVGGVYDIPFIGGVFPVPSFIKHGIDILIVGAHGVPFE